MTHDVLDVTMTGHLLPTDNLRAYELFNPYVPSIEFTHPQLPTGNRSFKNHFDKQDDYENDYENDYDNDYHYSFNRNDEVLLAS